MAVNKAHLLAALLAAAHLLPPPLAAPVGVGPAPTVTPGLDCAPVGLLVAVIKGVDRDESSMDSF